MNAVNSVQLFLLVWTFTAVCRADVDVCSVRCEEVTGTVGEEVTLTCSVSQKSTECCITMYKFQYPENYKAKEICKQYLPEDSCKQRNSFTCRYTPTTAMTGKFRFYWQTKSGWKNPEFTVNIKEASKHKTDTEAPRRETPSPTGGHSESRKEDNTRSTGTVVAAVMGCFFIIIIIMIIMYKRKPNYFKSSRLQKWVFLGRRQEQSPQNEINITDSTV